MIHNIIPSTSSVFLQTNRNYQDYSKVLRQIIYTANNVENVIRKVYPEFVMNPVVLDSELQCVGIKKNEKCLIGFNHNVYTGLAYYAIYGTIYLCAKEDHLKWYFDGYNCYWQDQDYANCFKTSIHRAMEEKTPEQKRDISFAFWGLRNYFSQTFKNTSF